jgi:hypothetical protein
MLKAGTLIAALIFGPTTILRAEGIQPLDPTSCPEICRPSRAAGGPDSTVCGLDAAHQMRGEAAEDPCGPVASPFGTLRVTPPTDAKAVESVSPPESGIQIIRDPTNAETPGLIIFFDHGIGGGADTSRRGPQQFEDRLSPPSDARMPRGTSGDDGSERGSAPQGPLAVRGLAPATTVAGQLRFGEASAIAYASPPRSGVFPRSGLCPAPARTV